MAFLLRKVHRPRWKKHADDYPVSKETIPASVFSKCLAAEPDNTLSVWMVESDDWDKVTDVLGALLSTTDGPSRAYIVMIPLESVEKIEGIEIQKSSGQTQAIPEINNKHRDLAELNFSRLGEFAKTVLDEVTNDKSTKVLGLNERRTLRIVKECVDKDLINPEGLGERWRQKL